MCGRGQRGSWPGAVFRARVQGVLISVSVSDFGNRKVRIPIRISEPVTWWADRLTSGGGPGVPGLQWVNVCTPGGQVCGVRAGLKVLLSPGPLTATKSQPEHRIQHTHLINLLHILLVIT